MYKLFYVAYIAFWLGVTVSDIGKTSGPVVVYEWWLPLLILSFLLPPVIAAYFAGKEDGKRGER
jgi:hypothetical protein